MHYCLVMRNKDAAAGRPFQADPPADADNERSGTVQSVDRAVTILELLAKHGSLGVTDLARELEVHKSTASRLVAALERRSLVEQVEERGKYRIGVGILRLAGATSARLELVQQARPVCRELADTTGDTVNLVTLDSGAALYIDQISGVSTLSSYNWVGQRIPVHATSNGKVLVSEMAPAQLRRTVRELTPYTPRTVTSRAAFEAELVKVRAQGYAVARDELDIGLTALAAPVRNAHGEIVASISVSGPTFRMGQEHLQGLTATVRSAADEVSARLGWLGHPKEPEVPSKA